MQSPKLIVSCGVQIAKADLQKIAESISQAQGVYKQLKEQRQQLSAAVEALKLMSEWQASPCWHVHPQVDFNLSHASCMTAGVACTEQN